MTKDEKTARGCASKIPVEHVLAGVSVGDITEDVIPEIVDKKEVKRLVSQGELMELPNSQKLLVKRLSIEPANDDRIQDVLNDS